MTIHGTLGIRKQNWIVACIVMTLLASQADAASSRVCFQILKGAEKEADREVLLTITNGASIDDAVLPMSGINVWLNIAKGSDYDALDYRSTCSETAPGGWDMHDLNPPPTEGSYSLVRRDGSFFPNVGTYVITGKAMKDGKVVISNSVTFKIVHDSKPPQFTSYLKGKKDCKGNLITESKPVNLGPLNETKKLKDNDYPFEPQKAFDVCNFERFPAFKMNPKFVIVWDSGRWTDESKFGGPLNRGFSHLAQLTPEDNILVSQRACFGYPGTMENICHELAKKDAAKYQDLEGWANRNYRSAWVSPSNAYELGWIHYDRSTWNGQRDVGLFTWDEEEMWPGNGVKIFKERPELIPEELKALKQKDPQASDPATVAAIEHSYTQWMAGFLGWGYKGAIDCAASRGRKLDIYHYGSQGIGLIGCTLYDPGPHTANPTEVVPVPCEDVGSLYEWYRTGNKVDFENNMFTRTVKYYHKDSYFFYAGAQNVTLYEKSKDGKFVLDANGRRKIRADFADDPVYATPTKLGIEDFSAGPANMKEFIAKQENTLFWFNGGKYYKQSGTLTSDRRPLPTMRPGTQPTLCLAAKLGSQPNPPCLVEEAVINNFMIGVEGFYLWDEPEPTGPLAGQSPDPNNPKTFGEVEFMIKGLHRLSQFNKLFDGQYLFVRPMREHNIWDRDQPVIRGIINGRYLLLAMSNPFLDSGEKETVEIWYDKPYEKFKLAAWSDTVTLLPKHNHLFQCKLPAAPKGGYDPDKLYFRFTCMDGSYSKTYTLSGNYNVPYPYGK